MDTSKGLGGLCASTSLWLLPDLCHQSLAWERVRPQPDLCPPAPGARLRTAPSTFILPTLISRALSMGELLQYFTGKITLIILSAASLAFVTVWCPSSSFKSIIYF